MKLVYLHRRLLEYISCTYQFRSVGDLLKITFKTQTGKLKIKTGHEANFQFDSERSKRVESVYP